MCWQAERVKSAISPQAGPEPERGRPELTRFAWLAIATAVTTITLKSGAYLVTGSIGLLSDAAESVVNLVAAVVALIALKVSVRPADAGHHYGHGKAEYFSAGLEGLMIFVAAGVILFSAVQRLIHPVALESVGIGLAIATVAAAINGAVGLLLIRTGRAHRSVTLTADGKHLMTDVWTSAGVIVAVMLVGLTGWERLDPIVAVLVGLNILVTGSRLVAQSVRSLLDAALPPEDLAELTSVLDRFRSVEIDFHDLRTRESGRQRFVSLHLLVPGDWTVHQGHGLAEDVEAAVRAALPDTAVATHLEPRESTGVCQDRGRTGGASLPPPGLDLG
jgi:cation diffusion facilitator family transporter